LVELVVDKRLQAGFDACDPVDRSADVHIASALSIGERAQVTLAVDALAGAFPIPIGGGFGAQTLLSQLGQTRPSRVIDQP
jgi:hypothetical protein